MGFFKLLSIKHENGLFYVKKGLKAKREKKKRERGSEAKYFCEIFSTWIKVGKQLDLAIEGSAFSV